MPRRRRATQILQILQIVIRSLHDRRPDALCLRQLGKIAAGHRVTVAAIDRVLVVADSFVIVNARADAIAGIYARRRFLEETDASSIYRIRQANDNFAINLYRG